MKIGIAIQLNHTREEELLEFKMSLNEIGIDPIFYGLIPFCDDITGAEEFSKFDVVIPYGTVKLIHIWHKGLLSKEVKIFYDESRFDQANYSKILPKEWLLNGEAMFTTLKDIKDVTFGRDVFIKPTKDLKAFPGIIVSRGRTPAEEIFSRPQDSSLTEDETVLVAPLRSITREYRNFVIDGKIVDSAIYKIADKITYEVPSQDERTKIEEFFDLVKAKYEPHDAYVVDFALLDTEQMVVIEYNCINCAGMYSVDRRKVFKALIEMIK